jgi:hypothetical protein
VPKSSSAAPTPIAASSVSASSTRAGSRIATLSVSSSVSPCGIGPRRGERGAHGRRHRAAVELRPDTLTVTPTGSAPAGPRPSRASVLQPAEPRAAEGEHVRAERVDQARLLRERHEHARRHRAAPGCVHRASASYFTDAPRGQVDDRLERGHHLAGGDRPAQVAGQVEAVARLGVHALVVDGVRPLPSCLARYIARSALRTSSAGVGGAVPVRDPDARRGLHRAPVHLDRGA